MATGIMIGLGIFCGIACGYVLMIIGLVIIALIAEFFQALSNGSVKAWSTIFAIIAAVYMVYQMIKEMI